MKIKFILDTDDVLWEIKDDSDLHNIYCTSDNGGTALFCIDPECEDNDLKDIKEFKNNE